MGAASTSTRTASRSATARRWRRAGSVMSSGIKLAPGRRRFKRTCAGPVDAFRAANALAEALEVAVHDSHDVAEDDGRRWPHLVLRGEATVPTEPTSTRMSGQPARSMTAAAQELG